MDDTQHTNNEVDREIFMQELEGDKEMRHQVNVYSSDGRDHCPVEGGPFKKVRNCKSDEINVTNVVCDERELMSYEYDDEEIRFEELIDDLQSARFKGEDDHEL